MNEGKTNELNSVIFNLELEGTYYYQDEEKKDDYFIAYRLIVKVSNQDDEDCEFELIDYIKSELSDENLIFTDVGTNSESHRIIELPEIDYFEFENGSYILLEETNIVNAIDFLKNIKTINFKDLKSNNVYDKKNFKSAIYKTDFNLYKEKKRKNNKKEITKLLINATLLHLTNLELALFNIDKAIELEIIDETESAFSYAIRAKINLKLSNKEKAIEDLKKALELDPNETAAINLLESLK
jgi:tetratricopeptide (TPR) repeat protein